MLNSIVFDMDAGDGQNTKPWRMASATLSDYFNYEFSEHAFKEYVRRAIR